MDSFSGPVEDLPPPPSHLFERLAQIPGYTWDHSVDPFHSSYDNWHVFGVRHLPDESPPLTHATSDTSDIAKSGSTRSSPRLGPGPTLKHDISTGSETESNVSSIRSGLGRTIPVIARVSTHSLRLEREYHVTKSLKQTSDPNCVHTLVQIEFVRLPAQQGDREPLVVSIFESPGPNHLKELVNFGPAWYTGSKRPKSPPDSISSSTYSPGEHIPLPIFLEFAIGASECLELLHHGQKTVHGEIRADAFHFNQESGAVKLINFGSGRRSFENGLTSAGWSSLSKELGVKNKLQFIAPEQTGRMPAEPDSRTDIYSLGVLFWSMLTREPAFDGDTPMDIVQSALNRRLPPVSSKRMDIPDGLSSVIQRMTQKQIDERYHSVSGLKHDLIEIHKLLGNGDREALKSFVIGSRDVSSFFVLPVSLFGREEQHKKILKVVETVSKRQRSAPTMAYGHLMGSNASVSTESLEDVSSDASSRGGRGSRKNSAANTVDNTSSTNFNQVPNDPTQHSPVPSKPALHKDDSRDSIATTASVDTLDTVTTRSSGLDGQLNDGFAQSARRHNSQKFRRRHRCEVITISGGAGLGKSSLVQSVQPFIRKLGYFASAKFDQARQAPFEPVLRVMSSLFRQIFAESDVTTEYHNIIRANVRPIWGTLHSMLDLPEQLISIGDVQSRSRPSCTVMSQQGLNKSLRAEIRDSSSTHSSMSSNSAARSTADFLCGGSSSKSLRFMNIFLEVLRVLSRNKLLCLCLDDLQFADEESLELLSNIVSGKLGVVLMVTYRQEGLLPANVKAVLETETANITRIELPPLSEDDVAAFVATTLYRPREYVFPLAAVCLERSMGNPFYLREMLQTCYRTNCVWYSWKYSQWEFDLDRVFSEFETETYGQKLNNDFVTRRLEELPANARSILAWASLLGNEFSFSLVARLLSGEFSLDQSDGRDPDCSKDIDILSPVEIDAVAGLQAALQSYILVPGEEDDVFRFSHDRYVQAATSLTECHDIERMHFIIAQTMMKYSSLDERSLYARAGHICQAIENIKRRIPHRSRFRELLLQAAQKATEAGARPTALEYFTKCLALLQQNPWEEGATDVYYEETLLVYTKSAEILWYQNNSDKALGLIQSVFANARTAADKAPCWILQSRVFAQRGDSDEAIRSLKSSLIELGLEIKMSSWEECDKQYKMLRQQLQSMDRNELLERPANEDQSIIAMGSVLLETMSASFWSDALLFYQMSLTTIEIHLNQGTNVQTGLEYMHLAIASIGRFGEIPFGLEMYSISQALLRRYGDMSNIARGSSVGTLFVAHLQSPVQEHIPILNEALEYSLGSGDRILSLICIGAIAFVRLSAGENMAILETYCEYAPEEFPGWEQDLQGGSLIIAIRQVARSLGGKTSFRSAAHVMADEKHNSQNHLQDIENRSSNAERPSDVYNSLHMIPLYLFGHYKKAIEVGTTLLGNLHELWTMRNGRMTLFYLSLSVLAELRESANSDDKEALLETVKGYTRQIEQWQAVCDANYAMWSLLLTAEVMELEGNMHGSIKAYEAAIDHTQVHGFTLEEALAFELQGEFLIRRGARRAARSMIQEAIAAWTRISAFGKAEQLAEKHDWLVNNSTEVRTADVGCQTVPSDLRDVGNTHNRVEENERVGHRNEGTETRHDRTEAWLSPQHPDGFGVKTEAGGSDLGLDVLDLQSIIEFSQVISSELQIDRLLVKMTEIILESARGADFGAIITEAPDAGWTIAAGGSPDNVRAYPEGLPFEDAQDQVANHIIFYTLRFRETVFVENILRDERFSNVSEQYMLKNPQGKTVVALPILQSETLLGVLYLEGPAKCLTRKTLVVLQLLCNQLGISIANALLFKRLRKVSASNSSMIETQRRALAQAREAEAKAKVAEAEAMRNVRLKEEAAKAKSMFLANVSHELRTPLNGVIGMSELLKGTPLSKEQDGYADSIRLCADTLLTVINDILDFSKLEAGKMKMFRVPLNLYETITEVVRALKYSNRDRGLETIEDLQLDRNLLVMGDPVRLHQVFMNLLSNSYKFTAKGSVTIRATTDSQTKDSIKVTCSVSDTGIGISKEQLSKLFKPFSQADNSTARSYGGSGLGLSICKAMVENVMWGKIWLKSKPGFGTTVFFTLTFPKAPKDVTVESMQITAKDPDPMAIWEPNIETEGSPSTMISDFNDLSLVPRNELRICIAEDNPVNQKIAVSFVKKLGFNSEAYSDGKQAVDALRRRSKEGRHFHLVLMDVQMPVLDGYEATKTIRKDEDPAVRGVLIIAMTASAIRGDREKCLEAGMNNYLAKPVRAAVLKAMLEEYLSQPPKSIPHLQETANDLAKKIVKELEQDANSHEGKVNGTSPSPTKDSEMNVTPRNEHIGQDPIATLTDRSLQDEQPHDMQR